MTGLLEDAKKQTFAAVSQGQTAWHVSAWGSTRWITLERTVNIMQSIMTPGAAKAFARKEVTIPMLTKYLPLFNDRLHGRRKLIYAMIGRHEDGRMAVYPGSTIDPVRRIYAHKKNLDYVRRGNLYHTSVQHVHRQMGRQGWDIEFRVLCCMDSSISYVWKFFVETIFIILLRSLDTTAVNEFQNVHVVDLVRSLEPCRDASDDAASHFNNSLPLLNASDDAASHNSLPILDASDDAASHNSLPILDASDDAVLRLNRCLPILQGFFPAGQDRTAALEKKCYWCGCTETSEWSRVRQDETLTKYECRNCHQTPERRTFDPAKVALREKRDSMRSFEIKDVCESCGETGRMFHHPDLVSMTICEREYQHYRKHGELAPERIQIHKTYPKQDHCEWCGSKHHTLNRHPDPDTVMTLCDNDYRYYQDHGHLNPNPRENYPMQDHCESCRYNHDKHLLRHPDPTIIMTICVREYQFFKRNGRLDPNWSPRPNYPMQDHCQSCKTTDAKLLRHPNPTIIMTICQREHNYYNRHGCLKP